MYRIVLIFDISDMSLEIVKRILQKKEQLAELRPMPHAALERLRSEMSVEWTYNSNAIEGNTLSLKETRMVLELGVTVSGKKLREHFEVNNHQKAIEFVENLVKRRTKLTEQEILGIHKIVLENIESEYAGRYRSGQVRIIGANFIPPNHLKINDLILQLISETNKNQASLDIVELVSKFHHRFVWIHPFFDGNGRTARLLMNLLLMRSGFPPAIILYNNRKQYYRGLDAANNGNYGQFILLIAQSVERSLDLYLECCGAFGDDEYVLLSALVKKFPYSQEYLSLLARQGKIDAHKKARNWLATRSSIEDYIRSHGKPEAKA
jgi:Fic family protein